MTLYLEDELDFIASQEALSEKLDAVIEAILTEEKVPYEVEISLTVVDKEEIQSINKEHRGIDKVTDVLSFPQIDPVSNGVIDWDNIDTAMVMNFDTDEIILGDVILCEAVAREQAAEYDHSLEREVCFLVAHSMFHLLGYDHMTPEEETLMISKQKAILEQIGITR